MSCYCSVDNAPCQYCENGEATGRDCKKCEFGEIYEVHTEWYDNEWCSNCNYNSEDEKETKMDEEKKPKFEMNEVVYCKLNDGGSNIFIERGKIYSITDCLTRAGFEYKIKTNNYNFTREEHEIVKLDNESLSKSVELYETIKKAHDEIERAMFKVFNSEAKNDED